MKVRGRLPSHREVSAGWRRAVAFLNPMRLVSFLRRVLSRLGWKFFVLLVSVNVGVKGIVDGFTRRGLLPYLKLLGGDAATYQRIDALGASVWGCRALLGGLSDSVPICGYNKRYYMVFSSLLGIAGVCLLAFLPVEVAGSHIWLVSLAVVLYCIEIAALEVMCAGKYSETMAANPDVKGDIVSFAFACSSIGSLLGCSLVGPISDKYGPHPVYVISLPFAVQPLVPVLLGFLPEKRHRGVRVLKERLNAHRGIFLMAFLISVTVLGIIAITMSGLVKLMVPYCFLLVPALIVAAFLCLPRTMALCNTFLFLWGVFNVSISGALDFFYTASPECLPDGPHFDYTYYSTFTALTGTVAEWIGIWCYNEFLGNWTFRHVFWLTSAIRTLSSLFDYMMVERVNVALGIPDKVMYMLGDAIIQRLVITLNFLPGLILTSKLCPRGMEATAYAIMDGMAHLGWNINKQLGAWAIDLAGIKSSSEDGTPCDFRNLGVLTLVTQVALPFLVVPLSFCLVPNAPASADLQVVSSSRVGEVDGAAGNAATGSGSVASEGAAAIAIHEAPPQIGSCRELEIIAATKSQKIGSKTGCASPALSDCDELPEEAEDWVSSPRHCEQRTEKKVSS